MSRDRAAFLEETLHSIFSQEYEDFEVLISDNSTNDDVAEMLKRKYPQARVIRRIPDVPALEHFRVVIGELQHEFSVIFHDDDIMAPGYLKAMVSALDQDGSLAAVACNAGILRDRQLTSDSFMRGFQQRRLLQGPEAFLEHYLTLNGTPAPFPGYLYRTRLLSGLFLDQSEGGKYSDVSFLVKLVKRGPILWLPDVLMYYRLHSGNDSGQEKIGDKLRLLRFICRETTLNRRSPQVIDYRFDLWRKWVGSRLRDARVLRSRRFAVAFRFVFLKTLAFLATRPDFRSYLWEKLSKTASARLRGAFSGRRLRDRRGQP